MSFKARFINFYRKPFNKAVFLVAGTGAAAIATSILYLDTHSQQPFGNDKENAVTDLFYEFLVIKNAI